MGREGEEFAFPTGDTDAVHPPTTPWVHSSSGFLLQVCSADQRPRHHLKVCWKCRILGTTVEPRNAFLKQNHEVNLHTHVAKSVITRRSWVFVEVFKISHNTLSSSHQEVESISSLLGLSWTHNWLESTECARTGTMKITNQGLKQPCNFSCFSRDFFHWHRSKKLN